MTFMKISVDEPHIIGLLIPSKILMFFGFRNGHKQLVDIYNVLSVLILPLVDSDTYGSIRYE